MKRIKWVAALLALVAVAGLFGMQAVGWADNGRPPAAAGPLRRAYWRALGIKTSKMQLRVVDATTMKGINGAGCVIGETGDRVETDANGVAPVIDAPVFRNPRLEQMLAELHGALTIICYKNGYRDAVVMGVRTYTELENRPEIWMYPVGRGDRRVEPTFYQVPIHRLWRIKLADKYRLKEEGEGPERPQLTNPGAGVAPQEPQGGALQTPPRSTQPQPTQPQATQPERRQVTP